MDIQLNVQASTFAEETMSLTANKLDDASLRSLVAAEMNRRLNPVDPESISIGEPKVVLSHLGEMLRKHLNANEETGVEWVSVVGEDSMAPPMKTLPARTLERAMWNILVQQGWSEGTLLYVSAQADRYKPEAQEVLFRIKVLCGIKRVGPHVAAISDWFANEEWRNA